MTGQTRSIWMVSAPLIRTAPLDASAEVDVCVVGAGIAGLTTAYMLRHEGRSVIVLEASAVGSGQTGRTTAHLSNALDDRYSHLEKLFGTDGARLAAESHTSAIQRIARLVADEHIDCDFERLDGYLIGSPGHGADELQRELEATWRVGLSGVRLVGRVPCEGFDSGPALRFPRQGQVHALKYLAGLLKGCQRLGVRVFTDTPVESVEGGDRARVETRHGRVVTARAAVVATNAPINNRIAIPTRQAGYLTYVIAGLVPRGSVPAMLCWDLGDPYHYVRLQRSDDPRHDFLLVGGEDHKVGQANDADVRYARLERWTRERFPMREVVHRWSGEVMEPFDSLAYIGRNPGDADNVYIITGGSGNGMTHGTVGGMIITDLLLGRLNPWARIYDPLRVKVAAGSDLARETLDTAIQYGDWLTGGDVESADAIERGEGAIVRSGLTKMAVYRREDGNLVQRSAMCSHLGCVVAWNSGEKTWDCPCHGSRFDAEGHVIHGPANADLSPASSDARRFGP